MSIVDVTDRIAQIQTQIASLHQFGPAATNGAAFAQNLSEALHSTGGFAGTGNVSGEDVVAEARKYLGLPYVWGGTDPTRGLDCSGLVQLVYRNLGIELPRVSADQARQGTPVASMAEAQPGDLIAWDNSSRNVGADHIAIYAGNGMMIEAPRRGQNVQLVPVTTPPDMIRRILPGPTVGATAMMGPGSGAASAAGTGSPAAFRHLFETAATKYGVSADLLTAVARQESAFNPRAVSSAGAQGLMQLMPATAAELGVNDPFDPAQAVDGAARLLRDLQQRFGSTELALAAYNAGPGAVMRYDGVPPYAETQQYVRAIMATLGGAA